MPCLLCFLAEAWVKPVNHEQAITRIDIQVRACHAVGQLLFKSLTPMCAMQEFWQHSWSTTAPTVCRTSALPPPATWLLQGPNLKQPTHLQPGGLDRLTAFCDAMLPATCWE